MIRILAIEDHLVALNGLQYMFRPARDGIEIACTASSAEGALRTAKEDRFDLILLDLWLGGTDPVRNIIALQERFPGKPVVIFTLEKDLHWQRIMYEAGARGYILKSANKQEIQTILARVAGGENVLSLTAEPTKKKQ